MADFDIQGLNDTRRHSIPVGDDAEGAGLGRRGACTLQRPDKAGGRPLDACEDQIRECVGIAFVVIEVEGLEEPGGAIFANLGAEGIPERGDGCGNVHAAGDWKPSGSVRWGRIIA